MHRKEKTGQDEHKGINWKEDKEEEEVPVPQLSEKGIARGEEGSSKIEPRVKILEDEEDNKEDKEDLEGDFLQERIENAMSARYEEDSGESITYSSHV